MRPTIKCDLLPKDRGACRCYGTRRAGRREPRCSEGGRINEERPQEQRVVSRGLEDGHDVPVIALVEGGR
jgi:hypothetical protein